jgi:hypothetical protein
MKPIHFVIYRLKSVIIIYCCCFIFIYWLILLLFFICSEIEFIKPSEDVKIQRKTITFTKDYKDRTIFINKMINSGIMRMFIFFFIIFIFIYFILLAKSYGFVQLIVVVLLWEICFFYFNDLIFLLFNNLMRNKYCIWIQTRGLQRWLAWRS